MSSWKYLVLASALISAQAAPQIMGGAPQPDSFNAKNRLFVLTDIGNEPDDQMSAVRLMLYSNEIDIEGIAATTSAHLRNKLNDETLREIVRAYGQVRPNLLKHAPGWPTQDAMMARVTTGPAAFGLAGIDPKAPSAATKALIAAVDRADSRPLWVAIWGGANTLAETLAAVRETRSAEELDQFVAKLRVYSISDQDDAGSWIRAQFPKLQYVVSPSASPDEYPTATWTGISGDVFYGNDVEAADQTEIEDAWLQANIRKGPLGALYPVAIAIPEGDTPSFLGLTANGLNSAMSPTWGGWGGRYVYIQPTGETRPIWSQGGMPLYGASSRDRVLGPKGIVARSDQATIWRWRDAYQNDFAARMDWTIKPRNEANHHPIIRIDDHPKEGPIVIEGTVGTPITLDASASKDPDSEQHLRYRWFAYGEAGARLSPLADIQIEGADGPRVTLTPEPCRPLIGTMSPPCRASQSHVILEVTDDGSPALTAYRRIIIKTR